MTRTIRDVYMQSPDTVKLTIKKNDSEFCANTLYICEHNQSIPHDCTCTSYTTLRLFSLLLWAAMEYVVLLLVNVLCQVIVDSRYLVKSATLKASPCTLCVKHGLSSLIADDTLCRQLVVRTATFKALPTCEAY